MQRTSSTNTLKLSRISSPYFVAGIEFNKHDIAVTAAPIIKYMIGWKRGEVIGYCYRRKWKYYSYPI